MNEILKNRMTGFFKAKIVAINPDKEKLEELLGEEPEEDPVYFYEKRDGKRAGRIDIFLENVSGGEMFKYSIYIEDEEETFKSGASRYLNQVGETQITNSEDNLFDSFKNFQEILSWKAPNGEVGKYYKPGARPHEIEVIGAKDYKIALKGEVELMWFYLLGHPNINLEADNLLDMERILDGDLSSISFPIDIPAFVAFAYVENNEETGYKQRIFKELIPLRDYSDYISNTSSKYTAKKFKKWHDDFEYLKDNSIYHFGRLQPIKEDFLPKSKEFDEDDSEY